MEMVESGILNNIMAIFPGSSSKDEDEEEIIKITPKSAIKKPRVYRIAENPPWLVQPGIFVNSYGRQYNIGDMSTPYLKRTIDFLDDYLQENRGSITPSHFNRVVRKLAEIRSAYRTRIIK